MNFFCNVFLIFYLLVDSTHPMVRGHWELHQWLITQGIERPRSAVSRSLSGDVALKDLLRGIGRGFSFEAPGKHIVPLFFLGHWIAGFGVYFPRTFFLGFFFGTFSRKNWKNLDLPVAQKKSEPYRELNFNSILR